MDLSALSGGVVSVTLDYRERADGLGVGGAAPNWRRARVALSVCKPEVFKVGRVRRLIYVIRHPWFAWAYSRRLKQMRELG